MVIYNCITGPDGSATGCQTGCSIGPAGCAHIMYVTFVTESGTYMHFNVKVCRMSASENS